MKTNMTALLGAAAALAFGAAVPAAHAQNGYDNGANYDGYCYAKKKADAKTGTIVGAIAGGLIGSQVSKHERGLGTVGGAVIGGAIGNQVGKSSAKCYNGAYYSYQSGYYTPPPAPDGYEVVYYNQRPDRGYYSQVYTTPPQAYNSNGYTTNGYASNDRYSRDNSDDYSNVQPGSVNGYGANTRQGWRDERGQWHLGSPSAYGWRDSRGTWHQGRVKAYGWRDSQGYWHESNNDSSYSNSYDSNGY
ncbi:MAG: glycine zipper 2TM domain-containing protein [Asticcacaulis sp.]